MSPRILIVAEKAEERADVHRLLNLPNDPVLQIREAGSVDDALEALRSNRPDCLILHLGMPAGERILAGYIVSECAVIALTPALQEAQGIRAIELGAQDCLVEGSFAPDALRQAVVRAMARQAFAKAARGKQASLRMILDGLPQIAWSCHPDGSFDYLNSRWAEYTGVPREAQYGFAWLDRIHPEDRGAAEKGWNEAVERGVPYHMEYRLRSGDGAYHWFRATALPVRGVNGEIELWLGTSSGIGAQKRAELALRQSEERLRTALAASDTGTFHWDLRTSELHWDQNLERLYGLPPGQTVTSIQEFLSKVHPDDRGSIAAAAESCITKGEDLRNDLRIIWPDGTIRWLSDTGRTYTDAEGRPAYVTGACVDITSRKEAEARLAESEARYRLLADALPQIVLTIGPDGKCDFVNERWPKYCGLPVEAAFGFGWRSVVHPEDAPAVFEEFERAAATGADSEVEFRIRRSDGEYRWQLAHSVPIVDGAGPAKQVDRESYRYPRAEANP